MDFSDLRDRNGPADFLRLADYCEKLCDGRLMPRQQDFRPQDVRWLLGNIYLTDVLDGGADYYVRLFGTFWTAIGGEDLTGKRFSELDDHLKGLRPAFDAVVAKRGPIFATGKLIWPNQAPVAYGRISIPFTKDDETVSMILVAAHYEEGAENMVFYAGMGPPVITVE